MSEWRPIEEAPEEGQWALVVMDGAMNCAYVEKGKLPEDWTHPENPNLFMESVTHWMPLPEPPEENN